MWLCKIGLHIWRFIEEKRGVSGNPRTHSCIRCGKQMRIEK